MSKCLCVHNDEAFYKKMQKFFEDKGHDVSYSHTCSEAYALMENRIFDVVLFDTTVPDCSATAFVNTVHAINSNTIIVVATEKKAEKEAIQAVERDAYDFLKKPFSTQEFELTMNRALETRSLKQEAESLRGERNLIYKTENFIGESPQIKKVFEIVNKVAASNSTLLLTGETGTGKELIAGAVHYNSLRAHRAFVKVNCAALPEHLLESELFGHEKGAFTGADRQRIGRFEQADGGTIFLDEIADMSLTTQAKVLRVIQEKTFERLGSNKTIKVDVRIIAASNKDLLSEIKEGRFREDLFYRLNVVTIYIPPLRERREDPGRIVGMLAQAIRLIWQTKLLMEHGWRPQQEVDEETARLLPQEERKNALAQFARRPWQAQRTVRQAKALSWAQLRRAVEALYACDLAAKGIQGKLGEEPALELLVIQLCGDLVLPAWQDCQSEQRLG